MHLVINHINQSNRLRAWLKIIVGVKGYLIVIILTKCTCWRVDVH